jgi:hypothetical protein
MQARARSRDGRGHFKRFRWPSRLAALLGRVPDAALARRAGVYDRTVSDERRRRGIAPLEKPKKPFPWTSASLRLLGRITDAALARRLGLSKWTVMAKRRSLGIAVCEASRGYAGPVKVVWTKAQIALLGKLSDARVARRLDVSPATVRLKRRELGIPDTNTPPVNWTPRKLALLGTRSDVVIARRLKIHRNSVYRKRLALGIPPAGHGRPKTR